MTLRLVPLSSPEAAEPPVPPTAAARLRLVRQLSEHCWTLSGRALPVSDRQSMTWTIRPLRSPEVRGTA